MSEPNTDLVETLWGTFEVSSSPPMALPILLRSVGGHCDARDTREAPRRMVQLRTSEVALNGESAECILYAAHFAIKHSAPARLLAWVMVDGTYGIPFAFETISPSSSVAPGFIQVSAAGEGLYLTAPVAELYLPQQLPARVGDNILNGAAARALSRSYRVPLEIAVTEGPPTTTADLDTPRNLLYSNPRGTRVAIMVQVQIFGHGYFSLDGIEVEFEPVEKTKGPTAADRGTAVLGRPGPALPATL